MYNSKNENCANLRKPSTFVFINKHKIKIMPIAKGHCVTP
jgi:hypothetical protein